MINHSEWEYENQDYLKEHYEKRLMGKDTHLFVRKFHCKGCGRVFYVRQSWLSKGTEMAA